MPGSARYTGEAGQSLAEEWRDVTIIRPGYQASSLGRVRGPWKILSPATRNGYAFFIFRQDGKSHTLSVHRAVCAAFHGPPPFVNAVARHIDGDCRNNLSSNLAWGTVQDNSNDTVRHGTSCKGVRNARSRLTESDVRAIRSRLASGEQGKAIAADYDVDPGTVYAINKGKSWAWLRH